MRGSVFRVEVWLVFGLLAALLILTGSGFLVAALYLSLASDLGPIGAALISGVICLACAGLVSLIGWLVLRSSARWDKPDEKAPDVFKIALAVGEALGGDLNSLAKNHRYGIVGAALIAGFAVGVSPKLRRSLRGLLDD